MGCISSIAKYLIFLFNFLIAVCGLVLIAFGAIFFVNENKGIEGITSFSIGGFAIAVGAFIFIVAFFGCCGAIKENSCMLTTYAVILITLFILQVVLGSLAFVAVRNDDDKWDNEVIKATEKVFKEYNSGNSDKKKVIDNVQEDLKCCGVLGPNYWAAQTPFPTSCCGKDATTCSISTAYQEGCAQAVSKLFTDNIKIIGGVALGFAVVELLGAIFACVVKNRH